VNFWKLGVLVFKFLNNRYLNVHFMFLMKFILFYLLLRNFRYKNVWNLDPKCSFNYMSFFHSFAVTFYKWPNNFNLKRSKAKLGRVEKSKVAELGDWAGFSLAQKVYLMIRCFSQNLRPAIHGHKHSKLQTYRVLWKVWFLLRIKLSQWSVLTISIFNFSRLCWLKIEILVVKTIHWLS
jgi:hypothetical protein